MKRKQMGRIGLVLVLAGVLQACGITRKYEAPEISTEVQEQLYRDHTSQDTNSMADISWNELFADAQLQQLISEGLSRNNDLQVAVYRIAEAQAVFRQSRQNVLPSLNFNPNVTFSQQSKAALNLPSSININLRTTTVQLPLGASWELDIWGKLASTKRSAMASFMQASASARAVQTQLISSVATNYYSLLALDKQLEITLQTIELRKQDVEVLEALKEASLADGTALAQAQAGLYAAEVSVPDIRQSIRETENAICVLLGRVPGPVERSSLDVQSVYEELRTGIPLHLVKNRPDVEAAEMAFRACFENVNVARASFYPSLTLSAKGGLSALTTNSLLSNSLFTSVAGGLLQPIYNNGVNKMNLRKAQAQQQQALFNFQQSLLTAGQEVSDALYAYTSGTEKEAIRVRQVEALERSLDYTRELVTYSTTTNYLDVIAAQQSLLSAQLAGVNDRLQRLLSVVRLYHALGGGWQ